jgi:hypothetical protein
MLQLLLFPLSLPCPAALISFHKLPKITGAEVVGEVVDALVCFERCLGDRINQSLSLLGRPPHYSCVVTGIGS